MFTGIVEDLGRVEGIDTRDKGKRLRIWAQDLFTDVTIGASIAVNGCCLTVVEREGNTCSFDVVQETLDLTCFEILHVNDRVNLERPMALGGRLDGHLVQGHIDCVGTVSKRNPLPDGSTEVHIEIPRDCLRYIVKKGSISVDGISLTVTDVDKKTFGFVVIPHTEKVTTMGWKQPGALVNIEVDLISKYVERLLPESLKQQNAPEWKPYMPL